MRLFLGGGKKTVMDEICERCRLTEEERAYYVAHCVFGEGKHENERFSDDDLQRICTIRLLEDAGAEKQEIVRFFHCVNNGCKGEQARFLRQLRNRLLDTVHEKQTLLDKVDYLLYTLQQ